MRWGPSCFSRTLGIEIDVAPDGESAVVEGRGTSNWDGTHVQCAVGNESTAMEVEQEESPGEWTFYVYFGIYSSFEEDHIEENYDMEP